MPAAAPRLRVREVRFFERKAPLDWAGRRGIAGLRTGTVVVAFSRRAVIGLACDPADMTRPINKEPALLA